MKWKKKGLIFEASKYNKHKLSTNCREFAQSPQTLVFDDFVRVYFSTRKKDHISGKYLSFISFVDFNQDFEIISIAQKNVIELGSLGAFDEHGIFPINILRHENSIYAYTCGWSRRVSVSVETSTGLAISNDNGDTFQKVGSGPILTSSLKEPMLVGDSFVKVFNGTFYMWYIFGQRWIEASEDEPEARVYKIAQATSYDGINWVKNEGIAIISDVLNKDECQALPTVIENNGRYHMFFCYREATDFRKNPKRGYKLGYAWSDNLLDWKRDDENSGISLAKEGWDSEMMCYPHVFKFKEKIYLLYNGNEFGKHGFGLAELEVEN